MGPVGRLFTGFAVMFVGGLLLGHLFGWWGLLALLPLAWWMGERNAQNNGPGCC